MLPTAQTEVPQCHQSSKLCDDGKECVLFSHLCDGEKDCLDGSDELGCPETCKPGYLTYTSGLWPLRTGFWHLCSNLFYLSVTGEFQCAHGKMCILEAQVCDGRPQCQDWSDEKDCRRPTKICEFRCADGSRCIPKKFVCDGETDCPDGTDELGCGRNFQGCVTELTAVLPLSVATLKVFFSSSCSCRYDGVDFSINLHQSVISLSGFIKLHLSTSVVRWTQRLS